MDIKEFFEYYEKYNATVNVEEEICVEHRRGREKNPCPNPIDFLDLYIEVIWTAMYNIDIDENIWFINDTEVVFLSKGFLQECKDKWLKWEKALELYDKQLDEHMERSKREENNT